MSDYFTDLWTVKMSDWMRGLIIAIITGPLTIMYDSVSATPMSLVFDWKKIAGVGLAGGLAYVIKNFITGNGGQILKNNVPKMLAYLIIPLMLLGSVSMQGCVPPSQLPGGTAVAEPWYTAYHNWSTTQKASFFMEMWLQQEADYKTMNAYPNKTETLIKALNVKREVLEQSRIPLRTYATIVAGGGVPDVAMEQQIVSWLTQLQMNFLTTGGK